MTNIKKTEGSVVFRINGGDKKTGVVIILITLGCLVLALLLAIGLMNIRFFENNPVLAGAVILTLFLILIYLLLFIVKKGGFARYEVIISGGRITGLDRRGGTVMFVESFVNSNLYIARARQQIGYVSRMFPALCYGKTPAEIVEDKKPSPDFMLLTLGTESLIEELKASLV